MSSPTWKKNKPTFGEGYAGEAVDISRDTRGIVVVGYPTPSEGWGPTAISTQPKRGRGPHHHVEAAVDWCRQEGFVDSIVVTNTSDNLDNYRTKK